MRIERGCYALEYGEEQNCEITLYGEVVEERPRDWITGELIEGDFIVQSEFLADLEEAAGRCRTVTLRMHSFGGDAYVGLLLHNRIRELAASGMRFVCVVDGVAMSAGSVIMCACDEVRVNPASLVMIHKCWSILWGGYNADELKKAAEHQESVDRAMASIYVRRTGLSETQILHMMAETTYFTGKEAVEKGFADVLLEETPMRIAASADGRCLFVGERTMHLAPGMFAPDTVPTAGTEANNTQREEPQGAEGNSPAPEADPNTPPEQPGAFSEGGHNTMTLEELRRDHADLVAEIENAARAAERQRLREIDEVAAAIGDPALVNEARFGESACDAHELAYRAAMASARRGGAFLAAMQADGTASGANAVPSAPAPAEDKKDSEAEQRAEADAFVKNLRKKSE